MIGEQSQGDRDGLRRPDAAAELEVEEPDGGPVDNKRRIIVFLALAFGISWISYIVRISFEFAVALDQTLRLIVKFGPSIAGVVMTFAVGGSAGIRRLGRKLVQWKVAPRWYCIALLGPLAVSLMAIILASLFRRAAFPELNISSAQSLAPLLNLFAIRLFAGGGLGEELGWRGFMLPELQRSFNPLSASIMIGACWGLWHLPAYGIAGTIIFSVSTISGAIIFTWMYNSTNGNLLLPVLMHAAINAYVAFLPTVIPSIAGEILWILLYFGLTLLIAIKLARSKSFSEPLGAHA